MCIHDMYFVFCINQSFVLYSHYKISPRAVCIIILRIFKNYYPRAVCIIIMRIFKNYYPRAVCIIILRIFKNYYCAYPPCARSPRNCGTRLH